MANINVPLGPMFDLSRCGVSRRIPCASCLRSPVPCARRLSGDFTALPCWPRRGAALVYLASSTTSLAFQDVHKGAAISSGRVLFRCSNVVNAARRRLRSTSDDADGRAQRSCLTA
jgi:hypothetical protein